MLIDSSIAQAYIESGCVDAFRASWLFEHTSVSSDLGRNAFTPPPEDLALRETVRKLERRICEAAAHFVPVNRPIWDALFPDWEAVQPTLDLIVGYPEPYDAVAAHSPDGQAHLIFDLIRWCNYAELDQLDSIIRNLLTHEITHLLIGHRYPAADAALESTDYLTRLDAYTFHEGFAHLLSYQATEIDCVDWHTPQLTEVAAASRAKLRLALTETDPDRQKQFLEEAVCGSYYEKFACMCGMLYLADRWETQGIDGLQSAFADYHGFAQRALSFEFDCKRGRDANASLPLLHLLPLLPPEVDRQHDRGVDQRGGEDNEREVALHLVARRRETLDE